MPGLVGVLVAVGMIVVVPLGLRLVGTPGIGPLRALWPLLGVLAAGGLLVSRGTLAGLLTLPYGVACVLAALLGLRRLLRWWAATRRPAVPVTAPAPSALTPSGPPPVSPGAARLGVEAARDVPPAAAGEPPETGVDLAPVGVRLPDAVRELAAFAALGFLAVAASGLVPERFGVEFLGYSLPVLGLTAAHFHFAGFAAALLAGLAYVAAPGRPALVGAAAIPAGTLVVLVGYFTGEAVELAGAVVLAAGLLATSWVVLRDIAPRAGGGRLLLTVSAVVTPVTMALAVWWALGEATGLAHPTLTWTAATHGVLNALGVGLAGVLAWLRTDTDPRPAPL